MLWAAGEIRWTIGVDQRGARDQPQHPLQQCRRRSKKSSNLTLTGGTSVKLTPLAVTAALVTSFSALQAQTAPNPPQKPQSNSLPPPNKSASNAPLAPKATPASEFPSGRSKVFNGTANDHLTPGKGVSSGDPIVGERGGSVIKATPAASPKSPSGTPVKSSPTQAASVDPPKVDPNAAPGSPLGAIHRSNPVIVRPPEPNAAEQSYSRDQGFVSQHGTRPDPRVSTMPSQKK